MKLQVPLRMPATDFTSSPTMASRSIFTAGVPPMTAASNSSGAPLASARAASSAPCSAIRALLAVTTGLPSLQRGLDGGLGRAVGAADQFDEDVDVRRRRQRHRIVEPSEVAEISTVRGCDLSGPKRR
jgi:hypothetical protein